MSMSRTVHNTNEACCSIPPVESDYTPKGVYKKVGDFDKVYVVGQETQERALICVFDIFGFWPQTCQGAEILSESLCATVYMPDFFEPNKPFPKEKFPPKTDEERNELQKFFKTTAEPGAAIAKLTKLGSFLKTSAGVKNLGVYGFCWGGKVTINASGENTPFSAAAIVHPAMLSAEDATKLTVPLAIYISKDEPVDEYDRIVNVFGKKPFASKCDNKKYLNMFHGWAAARADLKDEENKREFQDVYTRLVKYFEGAWLHLSKI